MDSCWLSAAPGVQYRIDPFLKYASEKEYGVYYHTGEELIETGYNKENIEKIIDTFG